MAYRVLTGDLERIIDERVEAAQERFLAVLEEFVQEVEARAAGGKAAAKPKTKKPEPEPAELDAEGTLTDLLGTGE